MSAGAPVVGVAAAAGIWLASAPNEIAADAVDATATVVSAASARSALRMQNARLIVVSTKLRKRKAMAMTAPRANRVKAVKADAAVEAGAVAMTEARV